ncbi:hypothetical protein QBC36DRAFT_105468 [Triangularia setosa]|uniref:Uncharacterized protein n=1 Tax=Triangularia setosa TaxID=2587417 RepID=A0AAN6WAH6_9PEZI|nr:hypothetical protein QBC36DRAFT_105468 [Podospora setosa]
MDTSGLHGLTGQLISLWQLMCSKQLINIMNRNSEERFISSANRITNRQPLFFQRTTKQPKQFDFVGIVDATARRGSQKRKAPPIVWPKHRSATFVPDSKGRNNLRPDDRMLQNFTKLKNNPKGSFRKIQCCNGWRPSSVVLHLSPCPLRAQEIRACLPSSPPQSQCREHIFFFFDINPPVQHSRLSRKWRSFAEIFPFSSSSYYSTTWPLT